MARILFDHRDLERLHGGARSEAPEYRVPVDVLETADAVEVVADLPGVTPESVEVTINGGTLVIAGRKTALTCAHRGAAFHLAERTFGQFACVVHCEVPVDASRATGTLEGGELHIVLPRLNDRRGKPIVISVTSRGGGQR